MAKKVTSRKKDTAPAVQESTALAAAFDYGDMGVDSNELISQDERKLAYLSLLQPLSDAVQVGGDKQIEGATPGQFLHSGTEECTDTLNIVIVDRTRCYLKRLKKKEAGVATETYAVDDELVKRSLKAHGSAFGAVPVVGEDKWVFVETYVLTVLLLDDAGENITGEATFNISSTKLTPYKKILNRIDAWARSQTSRRSPPLFAFRFTLTSKMEKRDQGNSHNVVFDFFGGKGVEGCLIDPSKNMDLLQTAMSLKTAIDSGEKVVDATQEQEDGGPTKEDAKDAVFDTDAEAVM